MPRQTSPLNDTAVKNAKPREKEYNLCDGRGLALRVKPTGSKSWILNYSRPFTKKRTNLSLGSYPTVSLAQARKRALDAHKLLAENIDPKEHRDEQHQQEKQAGENTLKAVTQAWLEVKRSKVSEDHADKIYRSLELHILAAHGNKPIKSIKAPAIIEALKPLAAKGSLEQVKRVCQRLNEVMYYAVNAGLRDDNCLTKISDVFQAPSKQHMPTIAPGDIGKLMNDICNASIKRVTRCLIEWQLHTMTRPGEAAGTKWEEIDFSNGLWTIPGERMKKGKEHVVPLTQQCLAILEVMHPISGHREHVFPSDRHPKRHIHPSTANVALKRMGYHGTLVSHGLRALASTTLNEHGFDPDIIESALAHVDKNEVRRAYNRAKYLEQRRQMMAWWSKHIEQSSFGATSIVISKPGFKNKPEV